jgi:hypothetical protein
MEATKERLLAWWQESLQNIRKGKWWLLISPLALWFLSGLAEHRFFHSVNVYLDEHVPALIARIRPLLTLKGSLGLPIIGFMAVLLVLIARAYFQTRGEATHKPFVTLVTTARAYEDAVLGMNGAVGAMIVAARDGNVAVRNTGNGPAINIRYEFRPVNPAPGANVARPHNYIQMLPPGETFVMPVARGLLNNLEYEFIASYESIGGRRYQTRVVLNNLVLTDTSFRRH